MEVIVALGEGADSIGNGAGKSRNEVEDSQALTALVVAIRTTLFIPFRRRLPRPKCRAILNNSISIATLFRAIMHRRHPLILETTAITINITIHLNSNITRRLLPPMRLPRIRITMGHPILPEITTINITIHPINNSNITPRPFLRTQ